MTEPGRLRAAQVETWLEPWLEPLVTSYDVDIRELAQGFEASVNLADWQIRMGFDPRFLERLKQALRLEADTATDAHASEIVATLYLHEVGHWGLCPFDSDGHGRILSGIVKGLGEEAIGERVHTLATFRCRRRSVSPVRRMQTTQRWCRILPFVLDSTVL